MIRDYNSQFTLETETLAQALSSLTGGVTLPPSTGGGGVGNEMTDMPSSVVDVGSLEDKIRQQEEEIQCLTEKINQVSRVI